MITKMQPPMPRIRPTEERDLQHLEAIERSAGALFRGIPELAWIADDDITAAEDHRVWLELGTSWVAVDESDLPIGFLYGEAVDAGSDGGFHIRELSVHADHQGRGIGRALIAAAIEHARSIGCAAVTLTTFIDVPWNAPFYARCGFVRLEQVPTGSRLAAILAEEVRNGLPGESRCAMCLPLRPAQ